MSATSAIQDEHTPGPWQFYVDSPSVEPEWNIVTNASRMRVIANVHIEAGNKMDLANAHLIASAPDLLAALQELSAMYTHAWDRSDGGAVMLPESIRRFEKAHADAAAAIARATGKQS